MRVYNQQVTAVVSSALDLARIDVVPSSERAWYPPYGVKWQGYSLDIFDMGVWRRGYGGIGTEAQ